MKIRYYDTDSKIFINIDDFAALITVVYTYVHINKIKHLPIKQASPTYDCPQYKTTLEQHLRVLLWHRVSLGDDAMRIPFPHVHSVHTT